MTSFEEYYAESPEKETTPGFFDDSPRFLDTIRQTLKTQTSPVVFAEGLNTALQTSDPATRKRFQQRLRADFGVSYTGKKGMNCKTDNPDGLIGPSTRQRIKELSQTLHTYFKNYRYPKSSPTQKIEQQKEVATTVRLETDLLKFATTNPKTAVKIYTFITAVPLGTVGAFAALFKHANTEDIISFQRSVGAEPDGHIGKMTYTAVISQAQHYATRLYQALPIDQQATTVGPFEQRIGTTTAGLETALKGEIGNTMVSLLQADLRLLLLTLPQQLLQVALGEKGFCIHNKGHVVYVCNYQEALPALHPLAHKVRTYLHAGLPIKQFDTILATYDNKKDFLHHAKEHYKNVLIGEIRDTITVPRADSLKTKKPRGREAGNCVIHTRERLFVNNAVTLPKTQNFIIEKGGIYYCLGEKIEFTNDDAGIPTGIIRVEEKRYRVRKRGTELTIQPEKATNTKEYTLLYANKGFSAYPRGDARLVTQGQRYAQQLTKIPVSRKQLATTQSAIETHFYELLQQQQGNAVPLYFTYKYNPKKPNEVSGHHAAILTLVATHNNTVKLAVIDQSFASSSTIEGKKNMMYLDDYLQKMSKNPDFTNILLLNRTYQFEGKAGHQNIALANTIPEEVTGD